MTNNKSLIILVVLLVIALGGLVAWNLIQRSELNEMVEQMTIEKEELQEEYEDLAIQFDGYQQMDIRNDSLQDLLSREQQRVQDLLEELRQTKASNARKIAELKKELATVRAVMMDYVRQIGRFSVERYIDHLTERTGISRHDKEIMVRFYTAGIVGVWTDWVEDNMETDSTEDFIRIGNILEKTTIEAFNITTD